MRSATNSFAAWVGLASSVLFLTANVRSTEQDVGYVYLLPALFSGTILLLCRRRALDSVTVRRSTWFLLAFAVYFLFRLLVDFGDIEHVKSFAFSTSGGLLFGYLFGALSSLFASTVSTRTRVMSGELLPILLFLGASALVVVDALVAQLNIVRTDFFLIDSNSLSYQRRGNFVIILALIASVLLSQVSNSRYPQGFSRWSIRAGSTLVYVVMSAALLLSAQIVGSNTGFVVSLALFAITLVWTWRPSLWRQRLRAALSGKRIGPFRMLRMALPQLGINALVVVGGFIGIGIAGLVLTDLTIEQFRIIGFSERTVGGGSLSSRLEILTTNFIDQFAVSPFFGNLRADFIVDQGGSYAHSLLSLLSHLGLVGTFLFTFYICVAFRELQRSAYVNSLSRNADVVMFKILVLGSIIGFALIGAFFTWIPLWFSLGFLHPPLTLESPRAHSNVQGGHLSKNVQRSYTFRHATE